MRRRGAWLKLLKVEQGWDDLRGWVAVITGGANGIGRAAARALSRQGADVVVADFDVARTERVVAELAGMGAGNRLLALPTDVRSDAAVAALAKDVRRAFGRVDILLNAAGVLLQGDLTRIRTRDWAWMLDTNLLGAVRTTRSFLPAFLDQGGGRIVNAVPLGALWPGDAGSIPYETGFAALVAYSQSLAASLAATGIRVSLLVPGRRGPRIGQSTRTRGLGRLFQAEPVADVKPSRAAAQVAARFIDGLRDGRFLILGEPADEGPLRSRRQDLAG